MIHQNGLNYYHTMFVLYIISVKILLIIFALELKGDTRIIHKTYMECVVSCDLCQALNNESGKPVRSGIIQGMWEDNNVFGMIGSATQEVLS